MKCAVVIPVKEIQIIKSDVHNFQWTSGFLQKIFPLYMLEGTQSVIILCVQWNAKVLISDARLNGVRSFTLNSLEFDIYFLPSGNILLSHCGMHQLSLSHDNKTKIC